MDRALRQTIVYFLTIATSQGLGFVLLPLVTHAFSPEQYGEYGLALSISALVATFGSLWVRNVSFRLYFPARAAGRTRAYFLTVAAFQAALVLALFLPTALVLAAVGYVPLPVMLASGAAVLAADFYSHSAGLVRAEQQAGHWSAAEIGTALVRFGATLAGLALGIRSAALLFLAAALAAGAFGTYSALVLRKKLAGPARLDGGVVRELSRHCLGALPFSVAGWGERLMDRIVLDRFLTRDVVGVYAANYALGEGLLAGLVSAVFLMAWPDILRAFTEGGKAAAREAVARGLRLHVWLTTGPAVFVALFHRELALLLGPEFRAGSGIMPFIAGAVWLRGLCSYLNRHLELELRFARLSAFTFAGAVLNLAASLVLVPWLGMKGAALATFVNLSATGLVWWFTRDRTLVRVPREAFGQVALVLAAAFLASRMPAGTLARPAAFVAVYAAGAAWFVLRKASRKEVSLAGG